MFRFYILLPSLVVMPARGRSSTLGRRVTLPNLSLAGKREDKTLGPGSDSNKKNSRNDRANRGGIRGRGRGNARGAQGRGTVKDKPVLIESAGIFSEGLSGTDPRRVKHERDFGVNGSRECVTRSNMDNERPICDVTGWEEMWESDEEGDMTELAELLRDGFISDCKQGSVLPLVLPKYDESQFIEIMSKHVKEELISDCEDKEKEQEMEDKKKMALMGNFDELQNTIDEEANPTLKYSRKAADIFYSEDSLDNTLFLLQLPSVLNVLTEANSQGYANGDINGLMLPLDNFCYSSSSKNSLPRGRSIGKLQITRKGRVLLKVGGYIMDVAKTTASGQQEGVMLLETCVQPDGAQTSGLLHMRSVAREGKDAIYYLGPIRHHLIASLDWDELKTQSDSNNESTSTGGTLPTSVKVKPADIQRMREELLRIDKERMQWSVFAEEWSTP